MEEERVAAMLAGSAALVAFDMVVLCLLAHLLVVVPRGGGGEIQNIAKTFAKERMGKERKKKKG